MVTGDAVQLAFRFSVAGAIPTGTATLSDSGMTLATLTLNGS